ncbi:CU044_2847 family protein [Streptomyces sp. NPDC059783]|uniref:CU044_2847 family protein n=1 Tax=Streptomyces sp. NPDC059783 TaxID=3346944 RepID=UPI00365E53CF
MEDNGSRITRIEMPDGTPVWARISGAGELDGPEPGGLTFTDTGFAGDVADRVQAGVQARVESLHSVVTSVARSLAVPLRAVRPDAVSVEFGIELTAKSGRVVGLLADGEAKGAIKVTLTWNGGGPPVDPPAPAAPPAQIPAPSPAPAPAGPLAPAPAGPSAPAPAGPSAPAPAGPPVPAPAGPPVPPPLPAHAPSAPPVPEPAAGAPAVAPHAGADPGAPAHPDGADGTDGDGA